MSLNYYTLNPRGIQIIISCIFCSLIFLSCNEDADPAIEQSSQEISAVNTLSGFELMPEEHTGVSFQNTLDIEELTSFVYYINVFNGGGVALGDINNDEIPVVWEVIK